MNTEIRRYGLIVTLLLVSLILVSAVIDAFSGGQQDGDNDYNCGTSCHLGAQNQGAGTIEVELDKTSVLSGQTLSVTVNVTESQLGTDSLIGVFLLSSKTGSDDHPSAQGWTITQDPNGGTYNYVEKSSPGSGETVTFRWTLKAPTTSGGYDLFVRVHHGSVARNALWEDYEGTITVEVSPLPSGTPEINHEAASLAYVDEEIEIEAWASNATRVVLHWRHLGDVQYNSTEMINTTEVDGTWWKFLGSIPAQDAASQLEYFLVAYHDMNGESLRSDTSVYLVSIEPKPDVPNMTAWTLQVVVVSEVALFLLAASIRIGKMNKEEKNG